MKKLAAGVFELTVGVIMIVVPEPATTATGVVIVTDGIRRIVDAIDN